MMTVKRAKKILKINDINDISSLMSLIFKNDDFSIARRVTMWHYFKNYWHATKWSSIFFSQCQCPSDGNFSFPRFIGLLILSLALNSANWLNRLFICGCIFLFHLDPHQNVTVRLQCFWNGYESCVFCIVLITMQHDIRDFVMVIFE
jgi:hypothetical protein